MKMRFQHITFLILFVFLAICLVLFLGLVCRAFLLSLLPPGRCPLAPIVRALLPERDQDREVPVRVVLWEPDVRIPEVQGVYDKVGCQSPWSRSADLTDLLTVEETHPCWNSQTFDKSGHSRGSDDFRLHSTWFSTIWVKTSKRSASSRRLFLACSVLP